jgi:nicotinate-nucleotide adenylyltransferase
MRIAMLGGTFNPVHLGHLYLADDVRLSFEYEKIVFVPANIPAHKEIEEEISVEQRIEMLKLAVETIPQFVVDTCEIERGGVSYTVDTIRHLASKYNTREKLGVIIGDDLLEGFSAWKDPNQICNIATLIVAHRNHSSRVSFSYPHRYIDNIVFPISSSDIRKRIRNGKTVRFLLPDVVWRYVEEHHLYQKMQQP